MKSASQISQELRTLQQKLKKREKWFKRIKWIFKPFIVVATIVFFVATVLPVIIPFAIPIVVAGIAAFIVRFVLYKYAFGDPKSKLQEAFDREILSLINQFGEFGFAQVPVYNKEDFDLIKVGRKTADGLSHGLIFSGKWHDVSSISGYLSATNESISVSGFLQDAAAGILDDLAGIGFDPGSENTSYAADQKNIFKGWVTELETEKVDDEWMIVPASLSKVFMEKSSFTHGWKSVTALEGEYVFATKTGETPQIALNMLKVLKENGPLKVVFTTIKGRLFITFPWHSEYTFVNIENDKGLSENLFNGFEKQFRFIDACAKALKQ
ncbi:MAG: hypothetical protein JXQ87_16955 [Bacteroidia bacterium]